MRGGVAAIAIVGAALIAVGCGGGSGATESAKDSAALDLVPKDAIGYMTIDTDFDGENWEQFNELATAFDEDFKGVEEEIIRSAEDAEAENGEEKVDYEKDVEPWLGEGAGIAILDAGGREQDSDADAADEDAGASARDEESEAGVMAWVELKDTAKFEEFAEDRGWEKGKKIGDWETYSDPDDETSHVAYKDDLAVLAQSRSELEERVRYDGDSISDADGVDDAIDEVGDDALMTLVLGGEGLRAAAKDNAQLRNVADSPQLKDLRAAAMSLSAEDEGMRLSGFVASDGDEDGENTEHPIFEELPADTVFALGGNDFGGKLQKLANDLGKDNAQVQQGVGAAEAAIGLDLDDLAEALDGEFAFGMSADDEGLGSLAGGVAGATMGGGLRNVDPNQLAESATTIFAFEETGDTSETLDKLVGAVGGLAGASGAPRTGDAGDFETTETNVAGFPVTTASSKDVAAVQLGKDVLDTWGRKPLGEYDTFKDAWDAADGPDKSSGVIWLDVARIAKLAGVEGGDSRELGGLVGWAESEGSDGRFSAFLHVPEA